MRHSPSQVPLPSTSAAVDTLALRFMDWAWRASTRINSCHAHGIWCGVRTANPLPPVAQQPARLAWLAATRCPMNSTGRGLNQHRPSCSSSATLEGDAVAGLRRGFSHDSPMSVSDGRWLHPVSRLTWRLLTYPKYCLVEFMGSNVCPHVGVSPPACQGCPACQGSPPMIGSSTRSIWHAGKLRCICQLRRRVQ